MKIIKEEQENKLTFLDLSIGDVFYVKDRPGVYMKTSSTSYIETMINMETGKTICACSNWEVIKLDATLTVKPAKQ